MGRDILSFLIVERNHLIEPAIYNSSILILDTVVVIVVLLLCRK